MTDIVVGQIQVLTVVDSYSRYIFTNVTYSRPDSVKF